MVSALARTAPPFARQHRHNHTQQMQGYIKRCVQGARFSPRPQHSALGPNCARPSKLPQYPTAIQVLYQRGDVPRIIHPKCGQKTHETGTHPGCEQPACATLQPCNATAAPQPALKTLDSSDAYAYRVPQPSTCLVCCPLSPKVPRITTGTLRSSPHAATSAVPKQLFQLSQQQPRDQPRTTQLCAPSACSQRRDMQLHPCNPLGLAQTLDTTCPVARDQGLGPTALPALYTRKLQTNLSVKDRAGRHM